ncbi:hypothetical protein DSO57_1036443 [Entomophthora muscae]|uniref:Uncharacterized protein n=1 Tax=Entomophthora muscae TaxID=34485 RepID=A0ACC2SND7_9FUNG|nr:hypothetical protein DSO57_1036443 [Entomophthora muscae]
MSPFFANFGFDLESFPSNLKESAFPQADEIANRMKEVHSNLIEFLTKARSKYKKYADPHCSPVKEYPVRSYIYLNARNLKLKILSKNWVPRRLVHSESWNASPA